MSEAHQCELCGGSLRLSVTMIDCLKCGTVWGRVEGRWVEVTPEAEKAYQECQRAFEAHERSGHSVWLEDGAK